jgi:hypothetical protein
MKYLKLFESFEDNQPVIETLETILSLVKSGKRLSSRLNGGSVMDLHDRCSDSQVMEILANAVDVISQELEGTKVDANHFIDVNELEGIIRILKANPEKSEEGMKVERFSKFVKESHSKIIRISDEEMSLFSDEPALQELISNNKITLKNGEVVFDENDEETKQLLDQYLEMPGKIEESSFKINIKNFKSFNEALAGHMGAVHSATRNMQSASGEEPSDKADEFSLSICTNPLYKRFANYNYKLKDVKIEKAEPKKGFISKLFSGSSSINFLFSKVSDNSEALLTVKLKGDKFVLANSSTTTDVMATIPESEQSKKFINYLLSQSDWKDELVKNFENIKEILTIDSFK